MHLAVATIPRQVPKLEWERLPDFIARAEKCNPPEWLIPKLVPGQGTLMLQGAPGGGKTWMCLVIAKEAAKKGRPVFFIEEESSTYFFGKRLKEMVQLQGLISSMMPATSPPVVILDPLVHIWVGQENETEDISRLISMLAVLRGFEDALITIPTHLSKGAFNSKEPSVYGSRGNSALPGWFDCVLNVEFQDREPGTEAMLVTPVKSRDMEMYGARKVVLTKGSGEVSIKSVGAAKLAEYEERILEFVLSDGPCSKKQIERALGGRAQYVRKLVDSMLADGRLLTSTASRSGTALITASAPRPPIRDGTRLRSEGANDTDDVGRGQDE